MIFRADQSSDSLTGAIWSRRFRIALLALAAACASVVGMLYVFVWPQPAADRAEFYAYQVPGEDLRKLWQLPAFSFIDHRHATVSRESLKGRPFIADFIFTHCTSACPLMTARMTQLQQRLAGYDLRFISFSIDPDHDDIATLAEYAQRWNPTESRWSLLTTDEHRLAAIKTAFRVTATRTGEFENSIKHSSVFFLVDGDSFVRGVYASDDPAALDRLVLDAGRMAATHAPGSAGSGSRFTYVSLGCGGCHDNPAVAPPLVNLRGAERILDDGRRITIDSAYLRRSILEPGQDVVKGYLPLMPSYRGELTDADVEALVQELLQRTSDGAVAPEAAEVVIDPVCHMPVRADSSAPSTTCSTSDEFGPRRLVN